MTCIHLPKDETQLLLEMFYILYKQPFFTFLAMECLTVKASRQREREREREGERERERDTE